MTRTWRTAGRVAAIGALALLLSACLKLDIDLQVQGDNTVSGGIIFGVDKQLLELTGGSVEDILGTSAPIPEDVEGVTTEPFEDDTFVGQQFSFEGVPLEEFSSGDLVITREGEVFRVSGALDLSSGLDGATGLSGLTGPFSPEELLQGAEMQVRMTFPGEVTESNGEVDGNTVTWIPVVGERLELQATASAIESGGGGSNLTLLLIIAAVVVLAAVVIGVVMSRRRAAPAGAGMGEPMAPGPMAPGEPSPPAPPSGPPPPPPPGV
jgi:hypothetical protein